MPESLEQEPKKSGTSKCLGGCCIALLIVGLLGGGVGFYLVSNWRDLLSNFGMQAFEEVLNESNLSSEDKVGILEQAERLRTAFVNEELDENDFTNLMEDFTESPILPVAGVIAVRDGILQPSGLPDGEVEQGTLDLERVARGLYEDSLTIDDLEHIMDPVMIIDRARNRWELKQNASDEDIREMLSRAGTTADENQIPEERFEVNLAEEFKRIVDNTLGGAPPPDEEAPTEED